MRKVLSIAMDAGILRYMKIPSLKRICQQLRRWIVEMTTEAQSGHLTSSLSAVELMAVLFFSHRRFFCYDIENPEQFNNDRLIFSKGHASPLFFALWAIAGGINSEELKTFRRFGSRLEGHPTREFPFTEVPTGSLGQGLGVGVGEALALRVMRRETLNNKNTSMRSSRVFVLLGDSELAEGSIWESVSIASYYQLSNLVAIVDVNRLGQRGETMDGWDIASIVRKFRAFGWEAVEIEDGHNLELIENAYEKHLANNSKKPIVFVAKTIKGRGISSLENKNDWHGKALSEEEARKVLNGELKIDNVEEMIFSLPLFQEKCQLSEIKEDVKNGSGFVKNLSSFIFRFADPKPLFVSKERKIYEKGEMIATRKVYGKALIAIAEMYPNLVVLDAEVSNSTFAMDFAKQHPDRFFEMFIAEQNMVSCATGMARRGLLPFVSTFSAFFSRAFDQIRMAQYAGVHLTFVGSHCGVSIGDDGASQMGLEDIAMFRSLLGSVVLYPSDAISMEACVRLSAEYGGITYIRTTRAETPVLYDNKEVFTIGGSKTVQSSNEDVATIITAGITVREALRAYDMLQKENICVRIIDAYSIKPIDTEAVRKAVEETNTIITVEDHYSEGGLGAAVREAILSLSLDKKKGLPSDFRYQALAVKNRPQSGQLEDLLRYEEIDAEAIVRTVKELM